MRSLLSTCAVAAGLFAITACNSSVGNTTPPTSPIGGYTQEQSVAVGDTYSLPSNVERACGLDVAPGAARCYAMIRTDIKGGATPDVSGYGPADLQAAYNLPSTTQGAGQTVALVDAFDDPNAEADLQMYRSTFGLPVCSTANGCFMKVNQLGQQSNYPPPPPPSQANWTVEISLDVDMVSAACPLCHIILVEGNDNFFKNLGAAEDRAVKMGANVISNSYGAPGNYKVLNIARHYNHPGTIILASAGDAGFTPAVPAGFPTVVAVGGTTLRRASGGRGFTETVWRGTGSGCDIHQVQPKWQTNRGTCKGRAENDVSSDSDPSTGVAVYDTYHANGFIVVGGTSAASPLIGGVYALAGNSSQINAAQTLYAKGASLFDVTSGTNGTCMHKLLCNAGTGWDGPTGNGTPNGATAF